MSSLKCFRVDDRLIHGQVMVGWILPLGVQELILIDNEAALDSWKLDAYRMAVDAFCDNVKLRVVPVSDALSFFEKSMPRTMLLAKSIVDAQALYKAGLETSIHLNLGGIHARQDRTKMLSYLCLDSQEMEIILQLSRMGVKIVAQDLPNSKVFDVVKLLKQKGIM